MYNTSFFKKILLLAAVVFLYSCDKDFNAIGDDIIGDNHFDLDSISYKVNVYNQEVTPVATNNLAVNQLGIFRSPVFGTTTANFATQVTLADYNVVFGKNIVIDSVKLAVPYFVKGKTLNSNGSSTYVLDSISGSKLGKLNLGLYESGVLMDNLTVDNGTGAIGSRLFYSDQNDFFDSSKKEQLNDTTRVLESKEFFFDAKEVIETTEDATTKVKTNKLIAPQMVMRLKPGFFMTKIFNAPAGKLANANVFQDYFRGLYFKVGNSGSSRTNMNTIDFSKGTITIHYKEDLVTTVDGVSTTTKTPKTFVINLKGNTVNLLKDEKAASYNTAVSNPNTTTGDERLFLKGGQGAVAVVELKDFESKLQEIRDNKWLINEANLVFYIDSGEMNKPESPEDNETKLSEPYRVYVYDFTNNKAILDYNDSSPSANTDPKGARVVYDGLLKKENGRGAYYKVRITNHIINIIKGTNVANVKLGVSVTENINLSTSNMLNKEKMIPNTLIKQVPTASVMSPLGTVIYGVGAEVEEAKKLKLQIYYTKPN
ncbi:DUF4270 family protein [Flavobacterium sp. GA093]|uniref:DUF4270 family protein n=1 Tax=Flavobacterium hydrocarbonoxydans TaxID=2683249 RepID=A0A6I4NH29_9FLAO|nr:DUF4270 domain-containing protein [Flavobacterium hydrocarbonoxydans]MWB93638.1 DUF4270 family protein [Flavobacterium hydrocarbonoxydans]